MKRVVLRPRAEIDVIEVTQWYAEQGGQALAERAARDATSKAQAIEDAVFDLKAVNPRERKVVDARTPLQLLEAIEAKGQEVDAALASLRALIEPAPP